MQISDSCKLDTYSIGGAEMTTSLVRPLFVGDLDFVGDVHGEIDALRSLMNHLGYDDDGEHAKGRRLVFLGDLTDRGPDSPAVVRFVQHLCNEGRAQCVLGNHDLNILLKKKKYDNDWFFGKEFMEDGAVVPQMLADETTQQEVLHFFSTLPIALERDDLRVVHASWSDPMIKLAKEATEVAVLYEDYRKKIEGSFSQIDVDPTDKELKHQNENPVKLLTSGPEEPSAEPVVVGGKKRHLKRVEWWKTYHDTFCVFGHYSIIDGQPRGNGSSFCIDYGVSRRWTERRKGISSGFTFKLAALQWPDMQIVFDDGDRRPCDATNVVQVLENDDLH